MVKDDSYEAGQHFAKHFPETLNDQNEFQASSDEPLDRKKPKTALIEVLEESNLTYYKRFVEENAREELEESPISIRNYLAFRNKGQVPENRKHLEEDVKEQQRIQASRFMCGIMDECTHLANFSVPVSLF